MYKRVPSRDLVDGFDREEILGQSQNGVWNDIGNPSWKRPLPHVLVATLTSFLFGYHLGVVNDTLESISLDLGFSGSTMAEGLVVSTCLGGAFLGSIFSGWIADGLGRRRAFQLSALPMILGASMSATTSGLEGMLLGRFFVGTGMGVGPPVAALYVSEVSPAFVRGTYGSFTQIATCFGLLAALFIGIPAKKVLGWWRVCFWVSAIPAALLALLMEFSAESPHWLFKLSGINAVFYFSSTVFKSAGVPSDIGNMCVGVAVAMGFQVIAGSNDLPDFGKLYLSIGGMLLFVLTFSLGAGPVPSLLLSEIFPNRIRAKAMAVCMAVHWVIGLGIANLFIEFGSSILRHILYAPVSDQFLRWVTISASAGVAGATNLYTIFATFCLIAVAFVKKNVVETKGKSLQEIEMALLPAV
ncbi:UNVERIFIED_CONTAM: putative plastidic glucose transporter 3 [Sesamum calycinum]|uniref:Plastidic glucose transporter 3 n=1 Tax=Sesamum calycinum TaxID=2727403 RepID=A0AAW2NHS6_9LAMI